MSRNKYTPDISWEDVSTYVREHECSTGYRAVVLLLAGRGPGGCSYVEVRLVQTDEPDTAPTSLVCRGEFPERAVARQMRCVLHVVAQAYEMLDRNPWLWTADRRRAARGDEG